MILARVERRFSASGLNPLASEALSTVSHLPRVDVFRPPPPLLVGYNGWQRQNRQRGKYCIEDGSDRGQAAHERTMRERGRDKGSEKERSPHVYHTSVCVCRPALVASTAAVPVHSFPRSAAKIPAMSELSLLCTSIAPCPLIYRDIAHDEFYNFSPSQVSKAVRNFSRSDILPLFNGTRKPELRLSFGLICGHYEVVIF